MKCVGKLGDEPVYEITGSGGTTGGEISYHKAIGGTHPVSAEDANSAHRKECPFCLFNSLIDLTEEFEDYAANVAMKVIEIDKVIPNATPEMLVNLREDRQKLLNQLALAAQSVASFKTLIVIATRMLQ